MNSSRDYIFNKIFEQLSVKEPELARPIIPVKEWVKDEFYVGKDGLKLYPFWQNVIEDIFESGAQYNQIVLSGGIGCTPLYIRKRTSLGYLTLEEISSKLSDNKTVYVASENGIEKVKGVHIIGEQPTKIIHFNDGSFYECTTNHLLRRVTESNIEWVRADELKKDDCILRTANSGCFPEFSLHSYSKFAYTIGYYIGDGDYNKLGHSIRIVFSEHKYNTESYSYVLNQLKEISSTHHVSIYESDNKVNGKTTGKSNRRFTIYSKEYVDMFKSCGLDACNKKIPDYINVFSKKDTCLLLAGLFDSDGCVELDTRSNNHLSISYSSRNKELIESIQCILFNIGINSIIRKQDRSKGNKGVDYRLRIQDFYSIQEFYNSIPLKVDYKKNRIKLYLDSIKSCTNYNRISKSRKINNIFNRVRKFTLEHHCLAKVLCNNKAQKSLSFGKLLYLKNDMSLPIEEDNVLSYLYKNKCYSVKVDYVEDSLCVCGDIEVEGSHTYISDGLINHNTGKSTCGIYILIRKLYELSCYKNIQGKFHLMDSALIVFLYFSLSKFQARRTGFKQFRDTIDTIPYFLKYFPRNPKSNDELRFPSNVYFLYGTGTGDAIGSNMIASLLDEANFFDSSSGDSTNFNEVADLHRALVARQESRFLRNGKNESLSIVVSSNTYKSSYTEELKKRSFTDPTIKFYRARSWDIKPKGTYSDITFYVFCGTEKVDPFIIESTLDLISKLNIPLNPDLSIKDAISRLPNELRVLVDEVPIDFKNQYVVNIVKALQDFSGYSTESTNSLFSNRNVFNSCIDYNIELLFSKTEFVIETMNDSPQNSIVYYLSGKQFPNPDKPRFIHVDLGLSTDACGIACCYQSGTKLVDGIEHPTFSYDFSIRIVPPPAPKKISIARTEEFLIYLRDKLHLTIGMISYDQFQSSSSQQRLMELGFPVRYQSVDRTDKAYLYFTECLYLNCVTFSKGFADDIANELFNLIHYRSKHKVDHPSDTAHGGCKDRMDAVVGALMNALECKVQEVNFNDTYALSYLNSQDNLTPFTEESSWLFDETDRQKQIHDIVEAEYRNMKKD